MDFLPSNDANYLNEKGITVEERDEGGQRAVVLKDYPLPAGKFDASAADVLILLPSGYPDAGPDMFYLQPWLKLADGGTYPRAADHPFDFLGLRWQRWSRHCYDWRPGDDGIWTMVKRLDKALVEAA